MAKMYVFMFIILLIVPWHLLCEDFNINDRLSLTWLNDSNNWGTGTGKIGPGDTVYIEGTHLTQPGIPALTIFGSGTENNEIHIVFKRNTKFSSAYFGENGAILLRDREYVILDGGDNGILESTNNGSTGYFTFSESNIGIYIHRSNNCTIKNFTIKNFYQAKLNELSHNTNTVGVYVNICNNVHVQNNTIYYTGQGVNINILNNQDIYVHHNNISRIGAGIFCGLSVDGVTGSNVQIYNNKITNTTDWGYNDGIKFFARPTTTDSLSGVKIYNNEIGPKISYPGHPGTAWILLDQGWLENPEIYNNLLVGDKNDNPANAYITVGGNGHNTGLTLNQNSKIYNNTIISEFEGPDIGILIGKRSVGHNIYNNIFKFKGDLTAIYINDTISTISDSNNNCFYSLEDITFNSNPDTSYDYAGWVATMNFDENSKIKNPRLDASYYPKDKNSPVVDAGINLFALDPSYSINDKDGNTRSLWDIGAYEFTNSLQLEIMPNRIRIK